MNRTEIREKAKAYNKKCDWSFSEVIEEDAFIESLRFDIDEDLEFEVMNCFYGQMLSTIIDDARAISKKFGFGKGYEWGKCYLYHYIGDGCLVSIKDYPALHSQIAYDIVRERLEAECWAGEDERQAELNADEE